MRKLLYLLIVSLLLVACAEAGDPVTTEPNPDNEVLLWNQNIAINGYAEDIKAYDDYVLVAEDRAGVSVIDTETLDRTWITSLANDTGSQELIDNNNIALVPERNIFAFSESDEADQVIFANIEDLNNPYYVGYTLGGVSAVSELTVKYVEEVIPDQMGQAVPIFEYTLSSGNYIKKGEYGYYYIEGMEPDYLNLGFSVDINVENKINGFDEDEDYYYVASGQRGFKIVEKTATSGNVIADVDTPGDTQKLTIVGNYLYVACRQEGLYVYDVTDRTNPVAEPIYTKSISGIAVDIDYDGNHLALACSSGGVYLFDVEDPANPSYIEKDSSHYSHAYCVAVKDNKVYVGGRDIVAVYAIEQ